MEVAVSTMNDESFDTYEWSVARMCADIEAQYFHNFDRAKSLFDEILRRTPRDGAAWMAYLSLLRGELQRRRYRHQSIHPDADTHDPQQDQHERDPEHDGYRGEHHMVRLMRKTYQRALSSVGNVNEARMIGMEWIMWEESDSGIVLSSIMGDVHHHHDYSNDEHGSGSSFSRRMDAWIAVHDRLHSLGSREREHRGGGRGKRRWRSNDTGEDRRPAKKRRRISQHEEENHVPEQGEQPTETNPPPSAAEQKKQSNTTTTTTTTAGAAADQEDPSTGRQLFVFGLAPATEQQDVERILKDAGCQISHVRLVKKKQQRGKNRRLNVFAYVDVADDSSIAHGLACDGTTLHGKRIKVRRSSPQPQASKKEDQTPKSQTREQNNKEKEEQKKKPPPSAFSTISMVPRTARK